MLSGATLHIWGRSVSSLIQSRTAGGSWPKRFVDGLCLAVSQHCHQARLFLPSPMLKLAPSTTTFSGSAPPLHQLSSVTFVSFNPRQGHCSNLTLSCLLLLSKKLHALPIWKSCGHDGITNRLLKLTADQIASHITSLFNRSLEEGTFPATWKEAVVNPVPKPNKDSSLPSSYRPVALLCSLSKVLEQLV